MARVRNLWNRTKKVALIWTVSAIAFYCMFQMALRNASRNSPTIPSDSPISNSERRSRLYDKLARDLDEKGALFLNQGETSQSLSLSDLFTLKDGVVTPILKAVDPPVRANVLHLSTEYSLPISEAVRNIVVPYFDKAIWLQNSSLYHFSMFHASHHIAPVPAGELEVTLISQHMIPNSSPVLRSQFSQIETEANAVKAVTECLCPLTIVLDRVVLTSTGVLLGCWQVVSGTDPITVRAKLKTALPRAPEKQLYDAAMLHTSFARLLGRPSTLPAEVDKVSELHFFHELVNRLNSQIHGMQATVSELWYVEEFDVLALGLNGRMKVRQFRLGCSKT